MPPGGSSRSGGTFDVPAAEKRLKAIDEEMAKNDFWDEPDAAQKIVQERSRLLGLLEPWQETTQNLADAKDFLELLGEDMDPSLMGELTEKVKAIESGLDKLEFKKMLSGEHDAAGAIVHVNAGAGGTEAQDWADMLLRMYLRYCEDQDWKTEIVELSEGEEAGIKSATFTVDGEFAYGYLKAEIGVHRLVRISPFDSQKRRHTSFASVFVYPQVDEDIDIEVNEADLRVDTYRASGAGGQHVNKTDSAVRLTHLPTGVVVACQSERSQHKNRATAMKLLKAKLYDLELQKRQAEREELEAGKLPIGWGSQIRSYVMQPYQMVKDLRTSLETSNVDAVLDGAIDEFLESSLAQRLDRGAARGEHADA